MSKFDKIFEAREAEDKTEPASVNNPKPKAKAVPDKPNVKPKAAASAKAEKTVQEVDNSNSKKRGRPQAKRSDPAYIGFTTYIRKDTHTNVKISLLQEGEGRELSELVEELLSNWTKTKHKTTL